MPTLCAGDDAAWDGCVAEGADVRPLAEGDWARSGVAKHKAIMVTTYLTMECLLRSSSMMPQTHASPAWAGTLAAMALRPRFIREGSGSVPNGTSNSVNTAPDPIPEPCRRLWLCPGRKSCQNCQGACFAFGVTSQGKNSPTRRRNGA